MSMNSEQKRLGVQLDVASPQFLPNTIAALARAREHLSKGRISVAAELMHNVENRLGLYNEIVAKRFLHREQ